MTLEGWQPRIGEDGSLEEVVEQAFDYRGNITLTLSDGSQVVGYLFNRDARGPEPFVLILDETGAGPMRIPYADIAGIAFTGKDPAAGQSWKAWLERKERERVRKAAGPGQS